MSKHLFDIERCPVVAQVGSSGAVFVCKGYSVGSHFIKEAGPVKSGRHHPLAGQVEVAENCGSGDTDVGGGLSGGELGSDS